MTQLPARFANRTNRRQIAQAAVTGLGSASPPYVSIKGGAFTLVDANGEQDPVETKHLDCVIVDANDGVSRVYWGANKAFDPNADAYTPPVCFSDNGIGASRNAQEPQSASCNTCQWNVWGSATSKVSGKGVKACGAMKKTAIIPLENGEPMYDFAFLLRIPVMSHDNMRVYSAKFNGQEFDVSDVVTRITFVHGAIGVLEFNALGFTDDAVEALVQKLLDAKTTDALVGRGDVPIQQMLEKPKEQVRPLPAPTAPAPNAGAPSLSTPFAPPASAPPTSTTVKRGRKPKAETAPAASPFSQAPAQDTSIPPFLQRQANSGTGIQSNAPPPPAEMQQAIDAVFKLKT